MKSDSVRFFPRRVVALTTTLIFLLTQNIAISNAEKIEPFLSPAGQRTVGVSTSDEQPLLTRSEVRKSPFPSLLPNQDNPLRSLDIQRAIPSRRFPVSVLRPILVTNPSPIQGGADQPAIPAQRRNDIRKMGNEPLGGPEIITPRTELVASTSTRILWDTSELSDSQVEYSVNSDFSGSTFTAIDASMVKNHQVELKGLSQDTTYYYRALSHNDSGTTMSEIFSFKTLTTAVNSWSPNKGIGSTPVISVSPDEKTVSISYKNATDSIVNSFVFSRPVVNDWNYKTEGKIYWVDGATGVDTNAGDANAPLKTIKKAIALVRAGDIIYVKAGTYVENVNINKSGTAAKPIILSAAPGQMGQVKIKLPDAFAKANPSSGVIVINDQSYVTVNGFVIEGPRGTPGLAAEEHYSANGVSIFVSRPGVRVTNNIIYNNLHCGIKAGINDGTGQVLMEGNIIFGNGTNTLDHGIYAPRPNLVMNGNIIFNNKGWGIHSYVGGSGSPDNQTITRNLVMGNAGGIVLSGKNDQVNHNTVSYNGIGMGFFRSGSKNNIVDYNIFTNNSNGQDGWYDNAGSQQGNPTGNKMDHNLYTVRPSYPASVVMLGPDNRTGNPSFVSAKTGDFRQAVTAVYQDRGAFSGPLLIGIHYESVTDRSAVITWTTDIPSDSWVEYGLDGGLMTRVVDPSLAKDHQIIISGLAPETAYTFHVRSQDSAGSAEISQNFSFTTGSKNVPPVLNAIQPQIVNENTELIFNVSAVDPDGNAQNLVYGLKKAPEGSSLDSSSGLFKWTPNFDQGRTDPYEFIITVSDGVDTVEQTVYVTVQSVNRPPIMNPVTVAPAEEGRLIQFTIVGSDPDKDALNYQLKSSIEGASFNTETGVFEWMPNFTQAGNYAVVFSVTDGKETAEQTVTIQVDNKNRSPELTVPAEVSGDENTLVTFTAVGTDADQNQTLAYSLIDGPAGSLIDPSTGLMTWIPSYDQGRAEPYVIKVRVTDGTDAAEKTVSVAVRNVNRPPVIQGIPAQQVKEDQILFIQIEVVDPDQDTLTLNALNLPAGASFDPETRQIKWTPTYQQAGEYTIRLLLSDGNAEVNLPISISVTDSVQPAQVISVAPGESIQSAIDRAKAGDTVLLLEGTHVGHVVLKEGVDLVGENAETTILDGHFETQSHVIRALGNNFIENLTITGGGAYAGVPASAIRVEGDQVRIRGNRIINNLDYGIYLQTEGEALIEDNVFINNQIGVQLSKDATVIRYNTFVDNRIALNILDGKKSVVESNIFTGSTYQSIYEFAWGKVPTRGYAVVRDNLFYWNTEKGSFYGSASPPSVETESDGNIHSNPDYVNPSAGNYAARSAGDRGAYAPALLRKAQDRAAIFSCRAVITKILDGQQLKGYRIAYPDGKTEEIFSDGTSRLIYEISLIRPRLARP